MIGAIEVMIGAIEVIIGAIEEMILKIQEFMASILLQKVFKDHFLAEMVLRPKNY